MNHGTTRTHLGSRTTVPTPRETPDPPLTEPPPPDAQRCDSRHPACPDMRCQRHLHRDDIACAATGANPWWSSFWVRDHP